MKQTKWLPPCRPRAFQSAWLFITEHLLHEADKRNQQSGCPLQAQSDLAAPGSSMLCASC